MPRVCDYDIIGVLRAAQKVKQKRLECMKRNVCANDTCKRGTSIMSTDCDYDIIGVLRAAQKVKQKRLE